MEPKKLLSTDLILSDSDKPELLKEKINFIDFISSNNCLLLLSSNNIIVICEVSDNNSIKIKKKLVNSINNTEINITMCYFCNQDKNLLLLFCDDYNIYEYTIDRAYISHIYYNILGDTFLFKYNWQKNSNPENGIKNFCIFNEGEIKIWNCLQYNKSNILCIQDIKCFSYDCTGIVIYVLGKSLTTYYISVIKFINEYDCKEIFFKSLNFIDLKRDINYMDIFDNNIIMSDRELGNLYILKNYPLNKFDFIININKNNKIPPLLFPFIGENKLYQFGIIYINFNENKQAIINICYKSNRMNFNNINIDLKSDSIKYFKENPDGKGLLLVFDDIKKELKKYII